VRKISSNEFGLARRLFQKLSSRSLVTLLVALAIPFGSAAAQTSKSLTAADPRATYAFFKKKELESSKPWTKKDLVDGKLNLADCYASQNANGPAEPLLTNLLDHAQRVVNLQRKLEIYPKELWDQHLRGLEESVLVRIADHREQPSNDETFEDAMAKKLSQYRKTHTELPRVVAEGGCGDGEVAVEIIATPKAKRIQYISFYYFELCEQQSLDPLDTSKCNRWTDFGSKDALFAGRYKVVVTWSNGQRSDPRVLDVDSLATKAKNPDDTLRYVIKQ
jgi:hypothetical protein